MNRFYVILVVLLLGVGLLQAQDSEITLEPVTDLTYHLRGVVPQGWTSAGQGLYRRGKAATDPTLMGLESTPTSAEVTLKNVASQLQLREIPQSVGYMETDGLMWTLYSEDVTNADITVTLDVALAEAHGNTYIVILQTATDEHEGLYQTVFLPAIEALRPGVPVADTLPYIVDDVTFKAGDNTLAGTLSMPKGDGPFAAVVLVSDSGYQDRDETIGTMKPFKLIADGLTQAGIAVLRYDDQGIGESSGNKFATIEETIANAQATVDYLQTRAEIDHAQIGVLAHGEGAIAAAAMGANDKRIAFIISMAGQSVSSKAVLLEQNKRIMKAEGADEATILALLDMLPKMWDALESEDQTTYFDLVKKTSLVYLKLLPEDQQKTIGDLEAYAKTMAEVQVKDDFSRWFRSFLRSDPTPDWEQTTVPVLAIFGGKDLQVPVEQNAPALEAALNKAGNTDFKIVTLPDANHLFQAADTGVPSEYSTLEPNLTPDFIPTIVEWLKTHVNMGNS